jgi:hypothetical protein
MPFLTELDERAQITGSRDPLGLVPIWSRVGREVVGNLTTVSNSVRGFTTLLLGLYFAEEVEANARNENLSTVEIFLKFEQMAGYARVRHGALRGSVRGLRRINARLSTRRHVGISTGVDDQILSNQKVYGLWGLFSMPARASELLLTRQQRLTPTAREFVERRYLPLLAKGSAKRGKSITDLFRRESFSFDVDDELSAVLARLHGPLENVEKAFYREALAWGGIANSTSGRQRQLAEILATVDTDRFDSHELEKVIRRAAKLKHEGLAASLERIGAMERLLNPARIAFGYLLTQDGEFIESIASRMSKGWSRPPQLRSDAEMRSQLRADIAHASGTSDQAERWMAFASALETSDHQGVIRNLVEMNTAVMQMRAGSAAWLAIESGRLRVRMADEREELLSPSGVEQLWRSTFFIDSLWNVAREVS